MSMCFGVTSVYSFVFSSLFPRYIRNETLEITHWCIGFLWKVVLSLKWGVWVWEGGAKPTNLTSDLEEVLF